jgi:hypothetical protein
MFLDKDNITMFGKQSYRIERQLNSGAVSDVYLAALQSPVAEVSDYKVVIKLVRSEYRDNEGWVGAIRREAWVLEVLNQAEDPRWPQVLAGPDAPLRSIAKPDDFLKRCRYTRETVKTRRVIGLLDCGEVEGQPFLVQEVAPPTSFDPEPVTTASSKEEALQRELRTLTVALEIARVIALAHENGFALKDFEPKTKQDRLCLAWEDNQSERQTSFHLKVIDWNITGGKEEQPQDLLFFGGHLYYFLLKRHVMLDAEGQPPLNPGAGVSGWSDITAGSRGIIQQLLQRVPGQRPPAQRLVSDLDWWVETLRQSQNPAVLQQLQSQLWKEEGNWERVLAIADLAIRIGRTPQEREPFEERVREAREKLESKEMGGIVAIKATGFRPRSYRGAAEQLKRLLETPLAPAAVRRGKLLLRQAEASDWIEKQSIITNPDEVLKDLDGAVDALYREKWNIAREKLQRIVYNFSQLPPPIQELNNAVKAGEKIAEAYRMLARSLPDEGEAGRTDWRFQERKKLNQIEGALVLMKGVQELAPWDPESEDRISQVQGQLDLRRAIFEDCRNAERLQRYARHHQSEGDRKAKDASWEEASRAYQDALKDIETALSDLERVLGKDATRAHPKRLREQIQQLKTDVEKRRNKAQEEIQSQQKIQERQRQEQERKEEARERIDNALREAKVHRSQREYGKAWGSYDQAVRQLETAGLEDNQPDQAVRQLETAGLEDNQPDQAKIQRYLAEAWACKLLEEHVQREHEDIEQHWKNANYENVRNRCNTVLRWHNRPLSDLQEHIPEGDYPGHDVQIRFYLKEDIQQNLAELQKKAGTILGYIEKAREAKGRNDHQAVLNELNNIEKLHKDYRTNQELKELHEWATRCQEREEKRGELLQRIQNISTRNPQAAENALRELRSCVNEYKNRAFSQDDASVGDNEDVLREAASKWLDVVQTMLGFVRNQYQPIENTDHKDLQKVRDALQEGKDLFSVPDDHDFRLFEQAVSLLETMLTLFLPGGEETNPAGKLDTYKLKDLYNRLNELYQSNKRLRSWADTQKIRLNENLQSIMGDLLAAAQNSNSPRRYPNDNDSVDTGSSLPTASPHSPYESPAARNLLDLKQTMPKGLYDEVKKTLTGLPPFIDRMEAYNEMKETIKKIIEGLVAGTFSWKAAEEQYKRNKPASVLTDAETLNRFVEIIEEAAAIETEIEEHKTRCSLDARTYSWLATRIISLQEEAQNLDFSLFEFNSTDKNYPGAFQKSIASLHTFSLNEAAHETITAQCEKLKKWVLEHSSMENFYKELLSLSHWRGISHRHESSFPQDIIPNTITHLSESVSSFVQQLATRSVAIFKPHGNSERNSLCQVLDTVRKIVKTIKEFPDLQDPEQALPELPELEALDTWHTVLCGANRLTRPAHEYGDDLATGLRSDIDGLDDKVKKLKEVTKTFQPEGETEAIDNTLSGIETYRGYWEGMQNPQQNSPGNDGKIIGELRGFYDIIKELKESEYRGHWLLGSLGYRLLGIARETLVKKITDLLKCPDEKKTETVKKLKAEVASLRASSEGEEDERAILVEAIRESIDQVRRESPEKYKQVVEIVYQVTVNGEGSREG